MTSRQVRPDFTPVLPVLRVESGNQSCNDSAHLQLEIAYVSRALEVLAAPGAYEEEAKLASGAFREAALWSTVLERRNRWLWLSWVAANRGGLSRTDAEAVVGVLAGLRGGAA